MIFKCAELSEEFDSKEALFKALKANEDKIIQAKKSVIYKSLDKNQYSPTGIGFDVNSVVKSALGFDADYIYPVINTTRYMDSHKDVHFDSIWKKTVKEKNGKIAYVDSHDFSIKSMIAWPEDVEILTKLIPWGLVGKNYEGETEALIYKIKKDKIQGIYNDIVTKKRRVQNSVSMQYVSVKMGINSEEKEYKDNKSFYDEYVDKIINKDVAEKEGYFFGVFEAKIVNEGSMVLAGSNDATAIIYNEIGKNEPPKGTQNEPGNPLKKLNELLNTKKIFN